MTRNFHIGIMGNLFSGKTTLMNALSENPYKRDLEALLDNAELHTFSERVGQIGQLRSIPDRIVLSTDFNPGTSPVLSPAAVMAMAVWRYRVTDPLLLLDAFTANPAEMLFLPDRGRIEPGAKADILLVDLDTFEQIPYYGTIPRIRYIVKNGKPIPGSHAS